MIQFPTGIWLYAPETLRTIAAVHMLLEHQPGVGNVWSIETLRRWLAEKKGRSETTMLREYVDLLPKYLVGRFISANQLSSSPAASATSTPVGFCPLLNISTKD